jgi:hypothetical protein
MKSFVRAVFAALPLVAATTSIVEAQLFTSIAPEARTSSVGGTSATFFASAINSGATDLSNCRPAAGSFPQAQFSYQTVDANNQLTGTPNTPVTIGSGATQGFLVAYAPPTGGWQGVIDARIECDERDSEYVPYLSGTLVIPSSGQLPDIVAISATPSQDGVIRINRVGGRGVMAVAAVNIGAAGDVAVRPLDAQYMTGLAQFTVCETDTASQCLAEPTAELIVNFAADQVRTFAVFARGQTGAGIPFYPDFLRVRLQMIHNGTGLTVGSTSAAFTAPNVDGATETAGVYNLLLEEPVTTRGGSIQRIDRGVLGILPDGSFYVWGAGNVFGGNHSEWVSHGTRPPQTNRMDSPASYIHFDSTGRLAVLDWFSGITPEAGIAGRYRPSQTQPGDPISTIEQTGRFRGAWLGQLNRRPTSVNDALGRWLVVSGNSVVGQFDVVEGGGISFGTFLVAGFTNCFFSGQLTQPDPTLNILDLELQFDTAVSNCGQPFNGTRFHGFTTIDVADEGVTPSGSRMPAFLADTEGSTPSGYSFLFVKA